MTPLVFKLLQAWQAGIEEQGWQLTLIPREGQFGSALFWVSCGSWEISRAEPEAEGEAGSFQQLSPRAAGREENADVWLHSVHVLLGNKSEHSGWGSGMEEPST